MASQTIKISKENLQNILNEYFSSENATVTIKTKKELVGYYETYKCVTTITVKRKIDILGSENTITETIAENKFFTILSEILEEKGLELKSLNLLNSIESRSVGYLMDERIEKYPVFGGVELVVQQTKANKLVMSYNGKSN